ncbi:MAG: extracellular solute-binding protein [Planctomycetota bacterium]
MIRNYLLLVTSIVLLTGCIGKSENEVVVYTALDKEFSETILDDFAAQSEVDVLPKYDKESNKTVGLAEEIINQQQRQRADVFWNNEILHTIRLKKLGLLEPYDCQEAENYPASFVSPDKDWFGFAARARVFIVNTEILPDEADWPTSIDDLTDPVWKDRCSIARPLFGTSSTHAAVMFSLLGEEGAKTFYQSVSENAAVESGNKQVAINVSRGRYAFGLTDTDDAIIEIEKGNPVAIVFPDQGEDGRGTLLIPNTIAIIKNGPNTENAQQLIDYLLQGDTERALAACPSAQIPLRNDVSETSRVAPDDLKVMEVDFEDAADQWEIAKQFLVELFP